MPATAPLRVGLLQCGHIPSDLDPPSGDYPEVFRQFLAPLGVHLTTYDVATAPTPDLDSEEGWIVSGSANSVYEPLPWIAPMEDLLRQAVREETPLVAVCFGHQLLAQALGSTVARADAGWGVGAHDYELLGPVQPWMDPPHDGRVRLIASHQDQVVELPDDATLLARTDHCPVAAYTVGDAALAIQPHPEFSPTISQALVTRRRAAIGDERADEALRSLDEPLQREQVGAWMVAFLRQALARR